MRKFVLLLCLVFVGCDAEKVARLEKQNEELKAALKKSETTADYDEKARCSKDARTWFNENWAATGRDKDTMLLDFTNHFQKKSNRCFILVEYHYRTPLTSGSGEAWTNSINLYDVSENNAYGAFSMNHFTYWKPPPITTSEELLSCKVEGTECKTIEEFNRLVQTYMSD
jgi:hypothetical protein